MSGQAEGQGMRPFDVLLVGVGGQGVLTIAEILAEAALAGGMPVNYYPSKGMAQRGGSVKAQVRLGRTPAGPNIPERGVDLVVALERSEALRAVRYVRPGGEFVLYDDVWAPLAVVLGKATYPETSAVSAQVQAAAASLLCAGPQDLPSYEGRPVSDNVFVLGLAAGQTRLREVLDPACVSDLLARRWPKAAARNLYAFECGLTMGN